MNRVEAVIHYASSEHRCRSQLLLQYFGETESVRCGKCDVCLERNELDISRYEFDVICDRIKKGITTIVLLRGTTCAGGRKS